MVNKWYYEEYDTAVYQIYVYNRDSNNTEWGVLPYVFIDYDVATEFADFLNRKFPMSFRHIVCVP